MSLLRPEEVAELRTYQRLASYLDTREKFWTAEAKRMWREAAGTRFQEPAAIAAVLMSDLLRLEPKLRGILVDIYKADRTLVLDWMYRVAMYFVDRAKLA